MTQTVALVIYVWLVTLPALIANWQAIRCRRRLERALDEVGLPVPTPRPGYPAIGAAVDLVSLFDPTVRDTPRISALRREGLLWEDRTRRAFFLSAILSLGGLIAWAVFS